MILGASAIRAALESGAIVCEPAPAAIEGAHIDVTLGEHWWAWSVYGTDVERGRAMLLRDADPRECFMEMRALRAGVVIEPRGFILAHTRERIGTAAGSGLVPMLHTRSTLARWGLSVCTANAGFGDVGFCGRWTLEIVNPHPVAVAIPVGARVGCLTFHRVEGETTDYGQNTRYNYDADTWTPASMLPRRNNW